MDSERPDIECGFKRPHSQKRFQETALHIALLLALPAQATIVGFTQNSNPAGLITTSTVNVESGTTVTTQTAPLTSGSYTFTHWTVDG
ncbi:MAG: hypothetical protein U1F87_16620, partial [Kiritimatiellia bacterium]